MTTSNVNVSPVIDLKRCNAFGISNRLNNPLVSSTNTFTGDGSTAGFTLSSTLQVFIYYQLKNLVKNYHLLMILRFQVIYYDFDNCSPAGAKIVAKTN